MDYLSRRLEAVINETRLRQKSILLLGPRQTGKTTLLKRLPLDLSVTLAQPTVRRRYERHPGELTGEIEVLARSLGRPPLVVLDEVQKVPELLDAAQDLIDRDIAQFILTGSSARKLRTGKHVNLLPGRVVSLRLDALTCMEIPPDLHLLPQLLNDGSLPAILTEPSAQYRDTDLQSYVSIYLEDEIRAEALVRQVPAFAHFLMLAAAESGKLVHLRKLSQEIGVAHTTIANYYQILEDCLIAERVPPFVHTATRRRLSQASKYLFFDLGVRRLAANECIASTDQQYGHLLEQWVGLELIREARLAKLRTRIYYWRDLNGPEVDWVIDQAGVHIPVEVKWTEHPSTSDTRHLQLFLSEYPTATKGFLVCRIPRPMQLTEQVTAIPWHSIYAAIFMDML